MQDYFELLPQQLKQNALFCCWKRETRNGQPTKIPYDPKTGNMAKSNDPGTFSDFDEAVWKALALSCNGIGIYVGNGFSAIDIDHCVVDGDLTDTARTIVDTMDSYTEYSPSGSGIRILFKTSCEYDREKYYIKNPNNGVEIYVEGATNRFVTVTGHPIPGSPTDIYERTSQLKTVLNAHMKRPSKRKTAKKPTPQITAINPGVAPRATQYTLTDDQIIDKASHEERFDELFRLGDLTYYNNDQSSADLALCNKLAFWCGCDPVQMDRIFRRSALMRPKWDSDREGTTYGGMTIRLAINDCDAVYDPGIYERNTFDRLDVPRLNTGTWTLTQDGVYRQSAPTPRDPNGKIQVATTTPIVPAGFIENLDTGIHRTELHYLIGNQQRSMVVDNETISNKNKIISLANSGISVTTATAAYLVDYLQEVSHLNQDLLPRNSAVGHLGWSGDKFIPYDTDVKFDGEASDRKLFRAITSSGTLDEWCDFMRPLRENIPLRLTMAASFASPLIERCGALPFIFHLWGKTGAGKTVALKVAMSVWGKPTLGDLMYTMNMTDNSMMNTAGFLYSLPFAGDELQLIKSSLGYDKLIMRVTEGIDRGRMKYSQKIAQKTWHNSFIFTGEEPCTSDSSGGGSKNRVIECCVNGVTLVKDGWTVANFCDSHYGKAGETFIEFIKNNDPRPYYDSFFHTICKTMDTTEKQAMAAAMLMVGDEMARQAFFPQEYPLSTWDVERYVKTNGEVNTSNRAREYTEGWIVSNAEQFVQGARVSYGKIVGDYVYVIPHILKTELASHGFEFDAVKQDWADSGFLEKDSSDKYTTVTRMGSYTIRCCKLRVIHDDLRLNVNDN